MVGHKFDIGVFGSGWEFELCWFPNVHVVDESLHAILILVEFTDDLLHTVSDRTFDVFALFVQGVYDLSLWSLDGNLVFGRDDSDQFLEDEFELFDWFGCTCAGDGFLDDQVTVSAFSDDLLDGWVVISMQSELDGVQIDGDLFLILLEKLFRLLVTS